MLNESQLPALKAAILTDADPAVIAALAIRNDNEIARLYNLPSTYYVWKDKLLLSDLTNNGFAWVEVDNLTVGKARIWEWMFDNDERSINPSKPNVRAGIAECWSGTTARNAVQAAILGHCKRLATKAERVYAANGDGTGALATPGYLGSLSGQIDVNDVSMALNLP